MGAGWRRFSEQASPSAPNRYPCHGSNGPLQPRHGLNGMPQLIPRADRLAARAATPCRPNRSGTSGESVSLWRPPTPGAFRKHVEFRRRGLGPLSPAAVTRRQQPVLPPLVTPHCRNEMMLQEAGEFAGHLKKIEKDIRGLKNATESEQQGEKAAVCCRP